MAQAVYTESMQANAARLIESAATWTRGRRKRDGLTFVIFPSSKPGKAHYANELSCTCPSYNYRGACSHVLAVHIEAEQARERAARPLMTYEEVFGNVDAF